MQHTERQDCNRSKDGLSALCCAVNQCVIVLDGPTAPFPLANEGQPTLADARPRVQMFTGLSMKVLQSVRLHFRHTSECAVNKIMHFYVNGRTPEAKV